MCGHPENATVEAQPALEGQTMIAILTVIVALPLGLLVRNRLAAYLIYAILFAQVFTVQTANLVMEWVKGSTAAFAAEPAANGESVLGYLAFTSLIYAIGFGLITLGHWLRNRRRTRTDAVLLDS
jgi:hypothetical protein